MCVHCIHIGLLLYGGKVSIGEVKYGKTAFMALVITAALTLILAGCAHSSGLVASEELETVAQGIDKSLMCPVCPSETLDQSQVEIANQMRVMVRDQLAQGYSRDEILQFFVDRYGLWILAEPPKSGFNLLVWAVPPVALVIGGGILAMTVRAMRLGQSRNAQETLSATAGLEPYLSAVDQEIQRLTQWDEGDDAKAPTNTIPEGTHIKAFERRAE